LPNLDISVGPPGDAQDSLRRDGGRPDAHDSSRFGALAKMNP